MAPPDPIPNSEVKRSSADDSVGLPHVKVGHRQVLSLNPRLYSEGFFLLEFLISHGFAGDVVVPLAGGSFCDK